MTSLLLTAKGLYSCKGWAKAFEPGTVVLTTDTVPPEKVSIGHDGQKKGAR